MFIAAIPGQYDDYDFLHAATKEDLREEVKNWVKDNLDTDEDIEIQFFDLSGKFKVSYQVVYEDLLPKVSGSKSSKPIIDI